MKAAESANPRNILTGAILVCGEITCHAFAERKKNLIGMKLGGQLYDFGSQQGEFEMMTVRFQSGFSVRYNDANFVSRHGEYSDLMTAEKGKWIAQVPNSAIIEVMPSCSCFNPIADTAHDRLSRVEKELRAIRRKMPSKKVKNAR